MRDLPLPQQLSNTGYWKELHSITILSGNLDVQVLFKKNCLAFSINKTEIETENVNVKNKKVMLKK